MLEPIHFQASSAITLELQINLWVWDPRTCIEIDIGIDVEIARVNIPLKGYRYASNIDFFIITQEFSTRF